jgi:hypothetical protein
MVKAGLLPEAGFFLSFCPVIRHNAAAASDHTPSQPENVLLATL